jgi:ribosomal protein S18 acetylase RimI-like enzyme
VSSGEKIRVATAADVPAITETISLAFHDDPTWSWAFPEAAQRQKQYAIWWRFLIEAAMRFDRPAVFVTDQVEAAAIWLPPGESELSADDEARVPAMVRELAGDHADGFMELLEGFETVQPADPPHYYLSLLGVHDEQRGRGIGMHLLRENLARFDAEGVPTYLESSNAANDHRYEALGYRKAGEFDTPDGSTTITAYWRDPA